MSQDVRDNVLSPSQWLRIIYMVLFAVVSWALGIVLTVLIVLQALFSLVTGSDNENLRQLGGALSKYYYQILLFLTYKSEDKPFPFAPFPDTPGAPPLDPEAPSAPSAGPGHASTVNTPAPIASADFLSEHEPEAAGSATAQPRPPRQRAEDDDVFAGISFTGPGAARTALDEAEEEQAARAEAQQAAGGDEAASAPAIEAQAPRETGAPLPADAGAPVEDAGEAQVSEEEEPLGEAPKQEGGA